MNTDTRQQIETTIQAFSGDDLRAASIGNNFAHIKAVTFKLALGAGPNALSVCRNYFFQVESFETRALKGCKKQIS
jgi:hypothetical protein